MLCFFSTGSLEWSRLTATEDTPWISASEILLGSCVDLFKKGFISTGLELIAGVGSFHGSYRYKDLHDNRSVKMCGLVG